MVRVTFFEGPRAGQALVATPAFTPQDILCGLSQYRYRWETDYSDATEEERAIWSGQELAVRCVRALAQGLPVHFAGTTYRADGITGAYQVASEIEEDILATKRDVIVASDDDSGITLVVR